MANDRRIDLPPAVTQALVGLGNFLGRHAAKGIEASRKSLLKEVGEALKNAGRVVEEAAKDEMERDGDDGPRAPEVIEVEVKEVRRGGR